eukprot:TRINITY_DN1606_c0_g2_i2.p1 TRINITY_DN1606_c0_g2~~TRINITY_DN1606_c0_g2_i2.p1  ORF type:complete len:902 (+),score=283.57 TRINITY_DN1606_c0_g2_i2:1012-3717(+)
MAAELTKLRAELQLASTEAAVGKREAAQLATRESERKVLLDKISTLEADLVTMRHERSSAHEQISALQTEATVARADMLAAQHEMAKAIKDRQTMQLLVEEANTKLMAAEKARVDPTSYLKAFHMAVVDFESQLSTVVHDAPPLKEKASDIERLQRAVGMAVSRIERLLAEALKRDELEIATHESHATYVSELKSLCEQAENKTLSVQREFQVLARRLEVTQQELKTAIGRIDAEHKEKVDLAYKLQISKIYSEAPISPTARHSHLDASVRSPIYIPPPELQSNLPPPPMSMPLVANAIPGAVTLPVAASPHQGVPQYEPQVHQRHVSPQHPQRRYSSVPFEPYQSTIPQQQQQQPVMADEQYDEQDGYVQQTPQPLYHQQPLPQQHVPSPPAVYQQQPQPLPQQSQRSPHSEYYSDERYQQLPADQRSWYSDRTPVQPPPQPQQQQQMPPPGRQYQQPQVYPQLQPVQPVQPVQHQQPVQPVQPVQHQQPMQQQQYMSRHSRERSGDYRAAPPAQPQHHYQQPQVIQQSVDEEDEDEEQRYHEQPLPVQLQQQQQSSRQHRSPPPRGSTHHQQLPLPSQPSQQSYYDAPPQRRQQYEQQSPRDHREPPRDREQREYRDQPHDRYAEPPSQQQYRQQTQQQYEDYEQQKPVRHASPTKHRRSGGGQSQHSQYLAYYETQPQQQQQPFRTPSPPPQQQPVSISPSVSHSSLSGPTSARSRSPPGASLTPVAQAIAQSLARRRSSSPSQDSMADYQHDRQALSQQSPYGRQSQSQHQQHQQQHHHVDFDDTTSEHSSRDDTSNEHYSHQLHVRHVTGDFAATEGVSTAPRVFVQKPSAASAPPVANGTTSAREADQIASIMRDVQSLRNVLQADTYRINTRQPQPAAASTYQASYQRQPPPSS